MFLEAGASATTTGRAAQRAGLGGEVAVLGEAAEVGGQGLAAEGGNGAAALGIHRGEASAALGAVSRGRWASGGHVGKLRGAEGCQGGRCRPQAFPVEKAKVQPFEGAVNSGRGGA